MLISEAPTLLCAALLHPLNNGKLAVRSTFLENLAERL
jgi:hypothetical protein